MAMHLNEKESHFDGDDLIVVIDGDTREEVTSYDAKQLAQRTATTNGLSSPAFREFGPDVFMLNADTGEVYTGKGTVPKNAAWRASYRLCGAT